MANDLMTLVRERRPDFEALLQGTSMTADRFANLFFAGMEKSYYLQRCAKESPETLLRALMQAAAVGVEVNTPLQHACIIPRQSNNKWTANFQMMFRGLVYLAVVHGSVSDWRAEAVYERDVFSIQPASPNEPIRHVPYIPKPKDPIQSRGDLVGAYSLIFLPNGMARAKFMPIGEIEQVRDRYSESWQAYTKDKSKSATPWLQRPAEMAIKTVVINHSKQIRMAGPAPVMIGEQVWQRGPAAVTITDAEQDYGDGELAPDERPRAAQTGGAHGTQGEPAAAKPSDHASETRPVPSTVKVSQGPNESYPTKKLVLTPDNAVDPGTQAIPEPEDAVFEEVQQDDRPLTMEEGAEMLQTAISLGLSMGMVRRLLVPFAAETPEDLKQSQVSGFTKAMQAEALRLKAAKK